MANNAKGPFRIIRKDNNDTELRYTYTLVNSEGRIVDHAFTNSPIPPKPLRDRQAKLNTSHYLD